MARQSADGRPPTHGRYSELKRHELREMIERYVEDPDPLNVLPEIAAARALFHDFVERYDELVAALEEWNRQEFAEKGAAARPQRIPPIEASVKILAEISKMVARVQKAESDAAIGRSDFLRVLAEMGRVVALHVEDGETLEAIKADWGRIRLA